MAARSSLLGRAGLSMVAALLAIAFAGACGSNGGGEAGGCPKFEAACVAIVDDAAKGGCGWSGGPGDAPAQCACPAPNGASPPDATYARAIGAATCDDLAAAYAGCLRQGELGCEAGAMLFRGTCDKQRDDLLACAAASAAVPGAPCGGLLLATADHGDYCRDCIAQTCCSKAIACSNDADCARVNDCITNPVAAGLDCFARVASTAAWTDWSTCATAACPGCMAGPGRPNPGDAGFPLDDSAPPPSQDCAALGQACGRTACCSGTACDVSSGVCVSRPY